MCTLLRAIAGNDDVKTSIVDAGGLGLIVIAMTTHAKQSLVAEQGCAALGSIALRSPANCTAIVVAGGVEAIVKAMQIHAQSAGVQVVRNKMYMYVNNTFYLFQFPVEVFLSLNHNVICQT